MTHALSAALVHFVWQGLAVTIVLWLALFAMRRRAASLRYAVSCAALAVLVLLPVLTAWWLYVPAGQGQAPGASAAAQVVGSAAGRAGADWLAAAQSWAVPVWACGVLVFSLRMVWGCTRIAALRRGGTAADHGLVTSFGALAARMGVTRPVRLLVSTVTDSPSVTGWLRPVVLLPISAATGLTADQLQAVLAHELAHIRRHDYLVNLLQMAAETLLFYHPAVWWISNRIREERELCCDDLAVRTTPGAIEYARALTALEKMRMARPAVALGSTDGPLFYRIRRLVTGSGEYGPSKLSGAVALALSVVCVALCVNWARGQEPPAREAVTVNTPGATLLHRSAIAYPESLRAKGVQGTVSVEVTLDASGEVTDAHILSGPEELRKPVLASVLNWHFAPGGGTTRVVEVTFQPQGDAHAEPQAVLLNVTVDANGKPTSIRVARSAGLEHDEQALREVKAWKFDPAQGTSQTVRVSPGDETPRVELGNVATFNGRTVLVQSIHAQLEREIGRNLAEFTLIELRREIELKQARLAELQKTYGPNHPEIAQVRNEMLELEIRLQGAQRESQQQVGSAQVANAKQQELKAEMAQLMDRLAEMRRNPGTPGAELENGEAQLQRLRALLAETTSHSMASRKLAAIEIRGLSEEAAADLLSRLPVHEGDMLTAESMESAVRIARQFDSHLEVSFGGEPEGAVLRIHPAGGADAPLLRRK